MKLYYSTQSGEVLYALFEAEVFGFKHTTNILLSILEIDEIYPENKEICIDLKRTVPLFDDQGQRKYYIENGELYDRDGWTEQIII